MPQVSPVDSVQPSRNRRAHVQRTARACSGSKFGAVCKALWPVKTDAELAFRLRCSLRAASYYLAGTRRPPPRAAAVLLSEIFD